MAASNKHMRLYYLMHNDYNADTYTSGVWDPAWYVAVSSMPLAEMMSATPVSMAEELIQLAITPEWVEMQRRPIKCGDIMYYGKTPYVFVRCDDIKTTRPSCLRLTKWSNYGILKLKAKKHKEFQYNHD